jgi:hypothetical protein
MIAAFTHEGAAVCLPMVKKIATFHGMAAAMLTETYWPVWMAR